jgi:hypothetical protein
MIKADEQNAEFCFWFMLTFSSLDMKIPSGDTVKREVTFSYGVRALLK